MFLQERRIVIKNETFSARIRIQNLYELDLTGFFGVAVALVVLGVVIRLLPSRSVEAPFVHSVGSDRSLAKCLLPSLKIALCSNVGDAPLSYSVVVDLVLAAHIPDVVFCPAGRTFHDPVSLLVLVAF